MSRFSFDKIKNNCYSSEIETQARRKSEEQEKGFEEIKARFKAAGNLCVCSFFNLYYFANSWLKEIGMENTKATREASVQILPTDKDRTRFTITVEIFPERVSFIRISWPLIVLTFKSFAEAKSFLIHNLDENNPRIFLAVMECIDELESTHPSLS
ncbi:MAG: hypothetical protein WC663_00455 [Patescibacteria group bacterium]|jgi:hypothetical protein